METLNLNKIPSGSNPVVHCSQYDVGRVFRFNLFEGSEVVTLDGTEVIECNVRKLDGTIVTVAVTNTSDSYIDVVTTEQMTAVHGSNYGEIVFKKGSDVIGTVNFILQVEKSPLEGGITSDSSIYNLETQIMDIVSVQYDSANVIFDNEGTSGHGIPYTVTSEGIKTMVDDAIALIPEELNDLSDVDITTPTSGEAVVWDGSKWVNGTVSTVGSIDDLNDVDTSGKAIGDSLRYNGNDWIAKPTTIEMTQADYNDIVDFTPYANTHIVITDAPNLNPTASDIEYSSGVTVKQAIDSKADSSTTYTKSEVDALVPKEFFLTISSSVSDSGISPFSYYGTGTKTDANIHNILAVSVYDTQFNNPSITCFYGASGSTYTFIVYSARSGNVRIRVLYD